MNYFHFMDHAKPTDSLGTAANWNHGKYEAGGAS